MYLWFKFTGSLYFVTSNKLQYDSVNYVTTMIGRRQTQWKGLKSPLQQSGVHHVQGQQRVVHRAENRPVKVYGRISVDWRRWVFHDVLHHSFQVGQCHNIYRYLIFARVRVLKKLTMIFAVCKKKNVIVNNPRKWNRARSERQWFINI